MDTALQAAVALHRSGRLAEAEQACTALAAQHPAAQHPDHPDLLHLIGVVHAQTGRNGTAIRFMAEAAPSTPPRPPIAETSRRRCAGPATANRRTPSPRPPTRFSTRAGRRRCRSPGRRSPCAPTRWRGGSTSGSPCATTATPGKSSLPSATPARWRPTWASSGRGSREPRPEDRRWSFADRRRSVPLRGFAPLLGTAGLRFYSLQKGVAAEQAREAPFDRLVVDPMGEVRDFADTASIVDRLDLVISVDTSVAHLAGALGKLLWLLSRFDGCWRWLAGREDSPWYPGMRVFRQPRLEDWAPVLERVGGELRRWAAV
ncbi:hypothetical protein ACIU1J_18970 [Azospirillum doebereinerae]|uniref:tetratricopeptide repeat protein n=1 Tax=Azospirillum doebereinerae TaxID=92933 RepID=UPI001EE5CD63|nr:hypothetical protein [Azospirillum doebereinerae]MCG5242476.1 hypothetical protein [Azospirillum doebereinerae]